MLRVCATKHIQIQVWNESNMHPNHYPRNQLRFLPSKPHSFVPYRIPRLPSPLTSCFCGKLHVTAAVSAIETRDDDGEGVTRSDRLGIWAHVREGLTALVVFMGTASIAAKIFPSVAASSYTKPMLLAIFGCLCLCDLYVCGWKSDVLSGIAADMEQSDRQRQRFAEFNRLSTIGILGVLVVFLSEIVDCNVANLIGTGVVVAAIVAKDAIEDMVSGLHMMITQAISIGAEIEVKEKEKSIEGRVMGMGLTMTTLETKDGKIHKLSNSSIYTKVIENSTHAGGQAVSKEISLYKYDPDKILDISNDIKKMLKSNPKVYQGRGISSCFLLSPAKLTLIFNLKHMSKEELRATEEDILAQSLQIIKRHGAAVGKME